jgi:UDP-N-acetylmuramoylalanine--D-glutamate ligase
MTVAGLSGKRIVILGLARQGLALARFLVACGASVTVSDATPAERLTAEVAKLGDLPVELALGGHPLTLLDGCDLLCLSGGVPPQIAVVQEAIVRGVPLSNDSLLTFPTGAANAGLGPLAAITGSSGKTTTTSLVGEMLKASGHTVHVGGNIGAPLIDRLDGIRAGEPIVLELSSFQLELFDPALAWGELDGVGPDVAAILNVTPNHLDRHPGMAAYAAAKFNLLRTLPAGASLVLSADDPVTAALLAPAAGAVRPPVPEQWGMDDLLAATRDALSTHNLACVPFSRMTALASGAWLDGDYAGLCWTADLRPRRSAAARRPQPEQPAGGGGDQRRHRRHERRAWRRWRAPSAACHIDWRSWPRPAARCGSTTASPPRRSGPSPGCAASTPTRR